VCDGQLCRCVCHHMKLACACAKPMAALLVAAGGREVVWESKDVERDSSVSRLMHGEVITHPCNRWLAGCAELQVDQGWCVTACEADCCVANYWQLGLVFFGGDWGRLILLGWVLLLWVPERACSWRAMFCYS
jgi:hypothetical protein